MPDGAQWTKVEEIVRLIPTMKSLGGVKSENGVSSKEVSTPNSEPEKIDFSKVKVEPLFEEDVDFDTFSKSDLLNVSKSTSSSNSGSTFTLEKLIFSFGVKNPLLSLAAGASSASALDAFLSASRDFIVGNFFDFSSLPFVMLRCAISIKLSSLHHHS